MIWKYIWVVEKSGFNTRGWKPITLCLSMKEAKGLIAMWKVSQGGNWRFRKYQATK